MLYLIYISFSKLSQIKLGPDNSVPEFSNITWYNSNGLSSKLATLWCSGFLCFLRAASGLVSSSSPSQSQSPITRVAFFYSKAFHFVSRR